MQQTFLRASDLVGTPAKRGRLPFSQATLWRLVAAQKFPAPVRLSPGVTAWPVDAVERWERERKMAEAA